MAQNWNHGTHTVAHRGRLIREYLLNHIKAPDQNTAILDITQYPYNRYPVGTFGTTNYTAQNHPTAGDIKIFREYLWYKLSGYVDSVGLGFRPDISDIQIGTLAGDTADLTGTDARAFIGLAGAPIRASAAIDSGVAKSKFKRGITQKAITSPTEYIQDAKQELDNLEDQALVVYEQSFKKYHHDYFFPEEEAKKRANEDRKVYLDILKKRYKEMYSVELEGEAKKHIVKTT
jgi:hypothetical protein